MKEKKIAKENVERLKTFLFGHLNHLQTIKCQTHKQTCQRWLEFLIVYREMLKMDIDIESEDMSNEKIKDLKQAIKLYEDAGI